MHPHVKKLLDLQAVDQELLSIRADLDSLPEEEARRRKKLETLQRERDEKKAEADRTQVQCRSMEKSITQGDEEIKKLNERLNTVKNNAEYQATLYQIESVKRERDQLQEECLELMEGLESLRAEVEAAESALESEQKVFEAFQAKAQRLREERRGQVEEVEQRRNQVAEQVPPDLLRDYERLFRVRSGLAVCPVEGSFCQGCYTNITTNDVARLMAGSTVVQCGSCQRILYFAE